MDVSGIPAAASAMGALRLGVDIGVDMQRKALDAATSQMAQLLEAMPVPPGLTFGPDGPSKGDRRRVIATL